jgi:hypothetical protein
MINRSLNSSVYERINNLQVRMAHLATFYPESKGRAWLLYLHARTINKLLWELPEDERAFLSDGGPEYIP